MSVTRLVLRTTPIEPGELRVPAPQARHARVARVAVGEPVEVLDLDGAVGVGRFLGWRGSACHLMVERVEHERGEPPNPVVLAVGVLHTAAFDWLVEKATELGATAIVPLVTARVQGRRHETRVDRWQRIAEAAVAQCGRTRPPRIGEPQRLAGILESVTGSRLMADPDAPPLPTGALRRGEPVTILVGPEGGLLEAERAAALAAGFCGLPLGPRTLRAETAALAALAVVGAGFADAVVR